MHVVGLYYTIILQRTVQKKIYKISWGSSRCTNHGTLQTRQGTGWRQQVGLKRRQPPTVIYICAVVRSSNSINFDSEPFWQFYRTSINVSDFVNRLPPKIKYTISKNWPIQIADARSGEASTEFGPVEWDSLNHWIGLPTNFHLRTETDVGYEIVCSGRNTRRWAK